MPLKNSRKIMLNGILQCFSIFFFSFFVKNSETKYIKIYHNRYINNVRLQK